MCVILNIKCIHLYLYIYVTHILFSKISIIRQMLYFSQFLSGFQNYYFIKICVTLNLKCIYSIHSYLYIYVCNYADNLAWSKRPSCLLKSGLPEPAIFDMSGFASGSELISAPASAPSFTSTSTLKHVIFTGT